MHTNLRTAALVAALIGFGATPAIAGHYGAYGESHHGSGHAAGWKYGASKYGAGHRAYRHGKSHGPGYRKGPGYKAHRGWHNRHGWHGWAGGHLKGHGYHRSVHRDRYAHPGMKWTRHGQADAYPAAAQDIYPAPRQSGPVAKQPAADTAAGTSAQAAPKNIVETAVAAEVFATLVSAVKAADLAEMLSGEGPFTVFAPTDEAFNALPEDTVPGLLRDKDALTRVLSYHVVAGRLDAADLLEQREVATLGGAKVRLDQLQIAKADVDASNGVIHIVDQVLLPPEG